LDTNYQEIGKIRYILKFTLLSQAPAVGLSAKKYHELTPVIA
jgi:hypothetical protein